METKKLKHRATISDAYSIAEIYSKGADRKSLNNFVLDEKAYKRKKKICKELDIDVNEENKDKKIKPSHINRQGKALKNMINIYMEEVLNDNLLNENQSNHDEFKSDKRISNQKRENVKYSSEVIKKRGTDHTFTQNSNDKSHSRSLINFSDPFYHIEVKNKNFQIIDSSKNNTVTIENQQLSSINKLAKKKKRRIFGEDNDNEEARKIMKIQKVEDSISNDEEELENNLDFESIFFIYPESQFKYFWNIVIVGIMVYSLLITPYFIAFSVNSNKTINYMEISIEFILLIDMILNFFVVTHNFDEKYILNHRILCLKYLKGYFFFDLISSLPISFFILHFPEIEIHLLILKFVKYFKIFKLLQDELSYVDFNKITLIEELFINSSLKRLFNFAISFLITSHILTCTFIYLARLDHSNWINFNNFDNDSEFSLYVTSVYFIWETILTIGYGDVITSNTPEKIFNIILLAFGVVIYSFGVTSLSSLITNLDIETAQYYKNVELVEDIRKKYVNISQDLVDKILKYLKYEYKFNNTSKFGLIAELPSRTRNSLLYAMYRKMILNFSFFSNTKRFKNDDFNTRIVLCMRPIRLTKNEIILKESEIAQEMFLIKHGVLTVTYNKARLFDLGKNDHFGDVLMMGNKPSPLEIRVKSKTCEMLIIKKQELIQIWKEFPMILDEIFEVSSENYNRIISMIEEIKKKKEKKEMIEKMKLNYQKTATHVSEIKNNTDKITEVQKDGYKTEKEPIIKEVDEKAEIRKKSLFLIPEEQPTLCEKPPRFSKIDHKKLKKNLSSYFNFNHHSSRNFGCEDNNNNKRSQKQKKNKNHPNS